MISLITISYNQRQFLPRLLETVLGQLGPDDEYIVQDPGSTDGSVAFIEAAAAADSRIKFLNIKDKGPADGLNKAFAAARGDILGYINSDDFLLPGAINHVTDLFGRNCEIDVVLGAIKMANAEGAVSMRGRVPDYPSEARLSADTLQYYQQGTFFKRSLYERVGGFNIENRTCWDRELVIDMALQKARFHVTSKPLAAFRIHSASITGSATNEVRYLADKRRIHEKVQKAGLPPISDAWRFCLKLEARWNPVRLAKQLRPVWL